jgi:arabinose-5-phosphate isomerase
MASAIAPLFERQKKYIDHFFQSIDFSEVEFLFEKLKSRTGTVICCGVGKSGLIAQKISATFVSTGTPSRYLSASNALHGDIGAVSPDDWLLAFSKSGESQELIDLVPYVKQKGARIVAIVSKRGSRLEKGADLAVHLPVERELCPFDLAPTTSTAIQLIFGDVLAVALMESRGFSIADFASNHPAGLLGRKITLKVADLMLQGVALPLCSPSDRLIDVLHELSSKRCGCLLVVDEKRLLRGIFTDGDLRRSIQSKGPTALETQIGDLMTASPKTISPDQLALEAMSLMEKDPSRPVTILPVLDGEKVIGLVRMHDILQTGL